MKRRKWVLQNHVQDADWAVLEQMVHRDSILQMSTVEHADSVEGFGGDHIPVGDLPFVAGWLWQNYKKKMEPIEVPECLRKPKYLKRKYYFTDKKNLPFQSMQKFFIKNVSDLKVFNSALYDGGVPRWNTLPEGEYRNGSTFYPSSGFLYSMTRSLPSNRTWVCPLCSRIPAKSGR